MLKPGDRVVVNGVAIDGAIYQAYELIGTIEKIAGDTVLLQWVDSKTGDKRLYPVHYIQLMGVAQKERVDGINYYGAKQTC